MRNGAKSSLTQAKIINLIISIFFIILLGYLIYFILISQKLDINIDITSDYNLNSINFKKQEIILAELKSVVEQNLPPSFNGDSAGKFLNARAMVIGDSTAEGLTAYGVLNSSSVVWTRGRTIQNMTEDLNPVIE